MSTRVTYIDPTAMPTGSVQRVPKDRQPTDFICPRCGGDHDADACPVPPAYDPHDWRRDSGGSEGCACKQ